MNKAKNKTYSISFFYCYLLFAIISHNFWSILFDKNLAFMFAQIIVTVCFILSLYYLYLTKNKNNFFTAKELKINKNPKLMFFSITVLLSSNLTIGSMLWIDWFGIEETVQIVSIILLILMAWVIYSYIWAKRIFARTI